MDTKPIDRTAARLGGALRRARRACFLSTDEASLILHLMPAELAAYERGITDIPLNTLEHMLIMAYKIMQIRQQEKKYKHQRMLYYKLKKTAPTDNE